MLWLYPTWLRAYSNLPFPYSFSSASLTAHMSYLLFYCPICYAASREKCAHNSARVITSFHAVQGPNMHASNFKSIPSLLKENFLYPSQSQRRMSIFWQKPTPFCRLWWNCSTHCLLWQHGQDATSLSFPVLFHFFRIDVYRSSCPCLWGSFSKDDNQVRSYLQNRIRIRMSFDLPDPDQLVRGTVRIRIRILTFSHWCWACKIEF